MKNVTRETAESLIRQGPVAILGMGISGQGAATLLGSRGISWEGFDAKVAGANPEFTPEVAGKFRAVVVSPGFSQDHPWVKAAREAGCFCIGEMDLGALFCRSHILAVTGTNGKTSLVEIMTALLRRAGRRSFAVGNIGRSFCDWAAGIENLPDAWAVCEVSSFQSEEMHYMRPDGMMWSNIAEDHLDRHGSMEAYFNAKWRLVELLKPGAPCILGESVRDGAREFGRELPAQAQVVTRSGALELIPEGTPFRLWPQQENYLLAREYLIQTGISPALLESTARQISLPRHRLEWVHTLEGVAFWNDSKGTNFSATLAALESFAGRPVYWIGGGRGKGGDLKAFAENLSGKILGAALVGEMAEPMGQLLNGLGIGSDLCATLEMAVVAAFDRALAGGLPEPVVLLSPGFASLDMFRSYAHRGLCFEKAVYALGSAPRLRMPEAVV